MIKRNKKKTDYDFSEYFKLKNQIKKQSTKIYDFLEWFIGFAEGDGSFMVKNKNLIFVINQADLNVLLLIQQKLHFGKVYTYKQKERIYARYYVSKPTDIQKLIALFNGNIQLEKVWRRFKTWVEFYNSLHSFDLNSEADPSSPKGENPLDKKSENLKRKSRVAEQETSLRVKEKKTKILSIISIKPKRLVNQIKLTQSWLAGFFDAEGGFYAQIGLVKPLVQRRETELIKYRLRLKTYLDQKDEKEILEFIANLFEKTKLTIRNQTNHFYRVELSSKKSLKLIVDYFSKHNLRSKKHIVYAMWKKFANLYIKGQHLKALEPVSLKLFFKRVSKIKKQNAYFKKVKTVLSRSTKYNSKQ